MIVTEGKAILNQVSYGRLRFFHRRLPELAERSLRTSEEESERFRAAQGRAVLELAAFYDQVSRQAGADIASVFAVHGMLLEDQDFVDSVLAMVRERGTTAEFAVQTIGESLAVTFDAMDSLYMQARAADIRDISRRMVRLLLAWHPSDPLRGGPAILVADEFLPSEVMDLDKRKLLGLVSRKGSVDSHTAMLLRAYQIPAMAEVELDPCWDGHRALLDGFAHRLYLDPDGELLDALRLKYQAGGKPVGCGMKDPLPL